MLLRSIRATIATLAETKGRRSVRRDAAPWRQHDVHYAVPIHSILLQDDVRCLARWVVVFYDVELPTAVGPLKVE